MNKLFLLLIITAFFSCSQKGEEKTETYTANDITAEKDSTVSKVKDFVDLFNKQGKLIEIKKYPIGNFKRIKIEVNKIKDLSSKVEYVFAILSIKYESTYYYHTKTAFVAPSEISEFVKTLKTIEDDYLNAQPTEETIVGFMSDDKARIRAEFSNSKWICNFHVERNTDESGITFTKEDIPAFIATFEQVSDKINSLSNSIQK